MSEDDMHSEKSTSSGEQAAGWMREGGVSYRVVREHGSRRVVFDVSCEVAADVEPYVSGEFSADGTHTAWIPGPDVDVQARAKELARRFGQRVVTRDRTD